MFARDIAIGAPPTAALAREIWVPPLGPIPPRGTFISEAGDPHLRNRGPSSPKQGTRTFEHLGASPEQGIDIPKAGDRYLPSRGSMLQSRGPISPEQIFRSPEQIFGSPKRIWGPPERSGGSTRPFLGTRPAPSAHRSTILRPGSGRGGHVEVAQQVDQAAEIVLREHRAELPLARRAGRIGVAREEDHVPHAPGGA